MPEFPADAGKREEVSSTNMQIRDVKEILSFACLSCGQYNTGIWERVSPNSAKICFEKNGGSN